MKVVKGLAFFLFFVILLGSCFEAPEFPKTPEIGLADVSYYTLADGDSISITINFRDGDGDLGLSPENPLDNLFPFNPANYFQTDSQGNLVRIETHYSGSYEVFTPNPAAGEIVFGRTRDINSLYADLPVVRCNFYETSKQFLIEDTTFLHKYSQIDTSFNVEGRKLYLVTDTVYFERNPNHYNFEIDFLVRVGGEFVELDYWNTTCTTFDGRFPVFSDKKSAMEGELSYGMRAGGDGFKGIIQDNQVQFKVLIRDRALHTSNTVTSQARTLADLKRN